MDGWSPKSDLFQLNFRFASVTLLVLAVGIAFGLLGWAFFRIRGKRLDPGRNVVRRHSAGHMLTHWLNAAGFLLAMFSGAVMLKWIEVPLAKVQVYTLHYLAAGGILVGFVATVVAAWSRGTTSKHRLMPSGKQVRHAFFEVLSYAGLVGDRGILGFARLQWPESFRREVEKAVGFRGFAPEGKYLAAEEVLSFPPWAVLGLLMIGTGILKAGRYAYPLPEAVVRWLTIVHDVAAYATVVMLVFHVGALVLVRTNWPLFASMFTGKLRADYVKQHLGEWYDELVREVERAPEPKGVSAAPKPAAPRKGR